MQISPDFIRKLAATAAAETLPRFRCNSEVANKAAGGFDPVTEADKASELAIRALIRSEFPGHGIVGEEFGSENADARHVWVIDPIDGTRAFISGLPLWGTLVGLKQDGAAVAGMMSQPFTGELFYSDGVKSYFEGPGVNRVLATRSTEALANATMMTTTPALFTGEDKRRYDSLEGSVQLARYGTDCYGYALVAAGFVDMVCECGLHSYDIVALIPIIEKAGGVVTTWDGGPAENGGRVLASANQKLHDAALAILNN